jgi:hypothetical protein
VPPRFVALVIAVLLFGGSLWLYAPSLGFGFIGYDEPSVLLAHPNLYNQPSLAASIREILIGYFPREEPLIVRDFSWLVDARLFGFERAVGYHLGNVLFNAANVVLLFAFLLHATRSLAFAGLVAALFSTLAIHVEPVCWVMGRKDLLGAFFTLLALLAQSIVLRQAPGWRRRVLLGAIFLLVPLAILSKFSAIVLVALLALHRLYAPFLDGSRAAGGPMGLRGRWRELVGLSPHLAVTAGLYFWYQHSLSAFQVIGGRGPSPWSLTHLKTVALLFPISLGDTVARLFSPGQFSIFYLRPNVMLPLRGADIVTLLATLGGSAALLWLALFRRKDVAFFVLAFFLFMAPYANVEYIGIWGADRYAYLSSWCVVALLVAIFLAAWRGPRSLARGAALVLLVGLALVAGHNVAAARVRQNAFRDARTFWDHELARPEPSFLVYESAAKTALAEAAAAAPGSPARTAAVARAVAVAERGLRAYESLPWQAAPGYFHRERTHAAGLHTAMGLAAMLAGRPPEERLRYHRMAYRTAANQHTALMLAQVLFDLAKSDPPREEVARESLRYFALYLREAKSDPLHRPGLPGLLRQYTDAFPGLADEVARVAEQSLR